MRCAALDNTAGLPVDPQVGPRIVAEEAANPLALVQFADELTEAEVSGAVPLRGPLRSGATGGSVCLPDAGAAGAGAAAAAGA